MVIYSDKTVMKGGIADAKMGPFYSPSEETIYIDPSFFQELKRRYGAKGDFAEAYVLAHEVGHHIQKIMKRTDYVHNQHNKISKTEYNKLSARLELHADFLAGVFAHHGQAQFKQILEDFPPTNAQMQFQEIGMPIALKSQGFAPLLVSIDIAGSSSLRHLCGP